MYGHVYTEEEHAFMREFVPGHSYREIATAFTEKFGWEISISQVNAYIGNHHLNTGRTGRFQKGQVPPNKGKKGVYAAGCEKTWFPKGHIPKNHRPVGSERVNKDGYVEVKVAEPNKWKLKHRIVWEKVNGPVPKGYIIIFRDNDKTNTDINNLLMIKRGIHAVMNHTGLCEYSGEFKDTAVMIAELKATTSKAKKGGSHGKS
ncbi:MAG: HNH endonuclease signature motif containing protein [Lachnospiraceae bacterium]|nr:HNH endonuclease signature motif containing protein [Lachnospiraceae bacterium]